jgi:hypothetical protein
VWRAIGRFGGVNSTVALGSTPTRVGPLGVIGGLLDAIGGSGWGAMVAATLIGWGMTPRLAIGSANLAEFFVTSGIAATFVATRVGTVADHRRPRERRRYCSSFGCFHDTEIARATADVSRWDRDCAAESARFTKRPPLKGWEQAIDDLGIMTFPRQSVAQRVGRLDLAGASPTCERTIESGPLWRGR